MKKTMLLMLALVFIIGCDYEVALVEAPGIPIDKSLIGRWQKANTDNHVKTLLVLPLDEYEYLVSFPADSENAMFARACLWRNSGLTLVQLNWFGTAQANLPDDDRTFQYAAFKLEDGRLEVKLLNPDVVAGAASSSAELIEALTDNLDNERIFRRKMVFRRQPRSDANPEH